MVVTVPSGDVGVLWKRFGGGTVLDPRRLKNEGFNLILPWNQVFLYDLRLQSFTESYNAISSDGVSLTATIIVRFPLPPAGGVPPTDNDTMNKERTTATSPTVPLEKTPAAKVAGPRP